MPTILRLWELVVVSSFTPHEASNVARKRLANFLSWECNRNPRSRSHHDSFASLNALEHFKVLQFPLLTARADCPVASFKALSSLIISLVAAFAPDAHPSHHTH